MVTFEIKHIGRPDTSEKMRKIQMMAAYAFAILE